MPDGIILSSASPGATKEAVEKVLSGRGLEVDKPAAEPTQTTEAAEPKRDAFESDEDFAVAHEEWTVKQAAGAAETEDEDEDDPAEKPQKKSKLTKRFEKFEKKVTGPLLKKIEELTAKLEGKGEPKEKQTAEPKRPVRADFKSDEEYQDALIAFGVDKATKEKAAKEAADAQAKQLTEIATSYRANVEAFKEEHDDWDETVNQNLPMHTSVQLAIMEQENGPEVIYYLGKHPEYTKKLAGLTPLSAVMEVGRLSDKLKAGSGKPGPGTGREETPKPPKPKVPAPVQPVSTAAVTSTLTAKDAAKNRNFKAFETARRAGR